MGVLGVPLGQKTIAFEKFSKLHFWGSKRCLSSENPSEKVGAKPPPFLSVLQEGKGLWIPKIGFRESLLKGLGLPLLAPQGVNTELNVLQSPKGLGRFASRLFDGF